MLALLPLKEFAAAKQRLSGLLSAAERAQLFQTMVEDVLTVLTAHEDIDRVAICSRDHSAVWLARYYEIEFIDEAVLHSTDLNSAVDAAAQHFARQGCAELLVVHGDLPLLQAAEISVFVRAHRCGSGPQLTIAPDRRRHGTNLMAWRPLLDFPARYGIDSLQRHCAQARALGMMPTLCDLPGAGCDIDEPEDLIWLLRNAAGEAAANTLRFLNSSDIADRLEAMHAVSLNSGERDVCA